MILGFAHEYTCQEWAYRIWAMNTKHAQCTCYTLGRSVLLLHAAHQIASVVLCDQVPRQC